MAQLLKHRWSLGHSYVAGITAGDWWRLLRENNFTVDPVYWHRAAFVSAVSFLNSCYRRKAERLYHDDVVRFRLGPPVVCRLARGRTSASGITLRPRHGLMMIARLRNLKREHAK